MTVAFAAIVRQGEAAPAALDAAARWFRAVSAGHAELQATVVPVPVGQLDWAPLARRSATAEVPRLVAELVRRAGDRAGESVLVVAPPGVDVAPHAWRLRDGGVHLGGRRWCRRYAVVPADAPLGTVAHELGHLLFGWPDLGRNARLGADCLMATGALVAGGKEPSWPCAPLRVAAGWVVPARLTAGIDVGALGAGTVLRWGDLLVERRADRLVVTRPEPLALVGRIEAPDPSRPVLALLDEHRRAAGGAWAGSPA